MEKKKRRFIDLKTTASDTPLKIKKDFKPPDRNRNFDVRGTNDQNKNIDKKVFSKLKKGLLKPEATLDLHGMSFDKANKAVLDFVLISSNKNLRLILIISGKGQERNTTDNFFFRKQFRNFKKITSQLALKFTIKKFGIELYNCAHKPWWGRCILCLP
jgi:DNA-nicking Smr family endonuclease